MNHGWPYLPIAIVAPLFPPARGGVERYVAELSAGLHRRGVGVEVVTTDPGARRPSVQRRDGIVVRRFPTWRDDRLTFPSPRLARWLGQEGARYSLLHAHSLHTLIPLAAAWAAREAGTPLVITGHYHGTGHTPLRALLHMPYRPLASLVAQGAAGVICNSEAERALLERDLGPGLPAVIVPEGVDPPGLLRSGRAADPARENGVARPEPDGAVGVVTILSVGRLEAYKGVQNAVEALPNLPADHRLVVVGDGPAREAIERRAAELRVTPRVLLRGRVGDSELGAWYRGCAVAISLSAHESFGLAVLEAAAAGAPVVASDIPAHREARAFVPSGRIFLAPLHPDGAALADVIRSALAAGRREDRSGWPLPTWDGLVEGTLAAYQEVLAFGRIGAAGAYDR